MFLSAKFISAKCSLSAKSFLNLSFANTSCFLRYVPKSRQTHLESNFGLYTNQIRSNYLVILDFSATIMLR